MAVVTGVLTITPTTLATNLTVEAGVGLTIAPMDRSQFTVMIVNSICELVLALRDDVITTFMFLPMEKYNVLRMMVMDADCQNQIAFFSDQRPIQVSCVPRKAWNGTRSLLAYERICCFCYFG